MDFSFYVIAALLTLEGLVNACGILFPYQHFKNYTEESIKAWCRPYGFMCIIMGVGLGCFNAYVFAGINIFPLLIIGVIGLAIGVVGTVVVMKKYLVKI